jgi:replicative DNA helicase
VTDEFPDSTEHAPPHDVSAEQAALGAMLLARTAIEAVSAVLDLADFYRPAHATIFDAILVMHAAGLPVDPITTAAHLRAANDLNRVGGASYLHTLVQATPTAANGPYYAEIVADLAKQRRLIETGTRLIAHTRQGTSGARRIAAQAAAELVTIGTAERWPDPIPLGSHAPLPAFPVAALTPWVAEQVAAVAEFTQTPVDLGATMALAALSTAAGGRVHVEIRPGWREQSNLYLVCAMPPASRKSDVFAAMTEPIYDVERQLQEESRARIVEAETAKEAALAEAEALMAKARKPGDGIDRTAIIAEASGARLLAEEIHVPPKPRLTVSGDITPEPLAQQLAVHRCLAALSPEGDLFDIIAGRYSAKPNLGVFLQAHKGERLQTDRITREQPSVDKPALTIGVTPQPAVLQDLAGTPGARDRGLLARFLYALPASNLGYRKTRTTPVPEPVAARYRARLSTLLQTLYALPEPVTVPLTAPADRAVEDLQDQLEAALRPEQPLAHLQDWAGKLVGHTARVALLLHLADRVAGARWGEPLEQDVINRAAEITAYYTQHALAVFDLIASDPATDAAHTILDWLRRPKTDGTYRTAVKRRDAVAASRRFRTVAQVEPALALLEAHGYLRADTPPRTGRAGQPASATYTVHPCLREGPEGAHAR